MVKLGAWFPEIFRDRRKLEVEVHQEVQFTKVKKTIMKWMELSPETHRLILHLKKGKIIRAEIKKRRIKKVG